MTPLVTTEPTYPVPTPEAQSAFADIITAFFRNQRRIGTAVLVFLLVFTAVFALRSRKYESRMLFLVRDEGSALPVTSFEDRGQAQPAPTATETQIGTEIELLSGIELHRAVITALHPGLSSAEIDRRLLGFNKDLTVLPVPRSTVISVTYTASTKDEANATLATLSRLYIAYRAGIKGNDGAYAFFDQEAKRYYQMLQQDQATLTEFNQKYKVTLLSEEKDVLLHKLADARATMYDNEASSHEADKQIQTMLTARATLPARVTTQRRDLPDQQAAEKLSTTLVELENKRVELLTKYHPTDRHVQEIDQEIANTHAALERAQQSKSVEEQSDLNPIRQTVEADLQKLTFQSAGLQARQRSLLEQVNDYETKLLQMNHITAQYDDLTRKVKEDESGYDLYFKKREDAQISRTLDTDKIANVRQVSGPVIVPHSNEQSLLSIVCIGVVGVLLIVGTGILSGLWSPRFHTPWELENAIGAPVLATIPIVKKQLFGPEIRHALPAPENHLSVDLAPEKSTRLKVRRTQLLSPLSRALDGVGKQPQQSGGAYLPLIEKLRKIDPAEPGGMVFAFTACTSGEGVSHFVHALGLELTTYTGKKVAIVNAPDTFDSNSNGDTVVRSAAWSKSTRSGEKFLQQWFQQLRDSHDYVLIDCPALTESRAAAICGPQTDGLLLVVGSGKATRNQLRGGLAMLSLASVRVVGLALNKRSYPIPEVVYNLL